MTVKTTTLTAVLALSIGLGAGTVLAQTAPAPVTPTPAAPAPATPAAPAPAAPATPAPAAPAPASPEPTPAPSAPAPANTPAAPVDAAPAPAAPAPAPAPATAPAAPVAPPVTGGTPEPVPPASAPELGDRPAAEGVAPAPAPQAGPAAEAAAETGTTTVPVPSGTTGGGEPPVTTQDNPAVSRGDAQPEATGSADPATGALANEPAPGQAGAETPQAAAPVVLPGTSTTAPSPGQAGVAPDLSVEPDAPTETVSTPGAAPAGIEVAPTPAGAPPEAAPAPGATAPAAAPGPDANEAPAAEAGHTTGEAAAPEGAEAPAAESHKQEITDVAFPFEGPFGKFDQFQLQRGLQVYTEVCSACHGMRYVPIRTLADAGGPALPEDQVRAYAAQMDIDDPETGETRPRVPTDHFPTNTSAGAPDLSVMAKARAAFHGPAGTGINQFLHGIGGPEYIYSILTHYTGETKEEAGSTFYENTAFPGGWIKMAPPLSDDQVTYEDGHPATVADMAKDVSAFLMWTAEPKMMARKQVGLMSVLFLAALTVLLYFTNKRLWWPVKHPTDHRGTTARRVEGQPTEVRVTETTRAH